MQNELNAQKFRLSSIENNNDHAKDKATDDQMAVDNDMNDLNVVDIQEKNQKYQQQINQLKQENIEQKKLIEIYQYQEAQANAGYLARRRNSIISNQVANYIC